MFVMAKCSFELFPRFDPVMEKVVHLKDILELQPIEKETEEMIHEIVKEVKDFWIDVSSTQIREAKKL